MGSHNHSKPKQKPAHPRLPDSTDPGEAAQLRSLLELSSDWYWEQDAHYRFTRFAGAGLRAAGFDTDALIGKTRWEIPGLVVDPETRTAAQAKLDAREPFYDFEYKRVGPDGSVRYVTTSGAPMFDAAGRFTGYRGIAKDITARKHEEQLLALEHAVNRCLANAKTASEAIQTSIRAVCETEGWECGRYFYADTNAGLLRFGEAWGVEDEAIQNYIEGSRKYTSPLNEGSMAGVWRTGEPLWSAEVSRHGHLAKAAFGSARNSFVFAVTAEGKSLGVLSFTSREVREPGARLLQAVRVIGSQIGQFLQRKYSEEALWASEARFRNLTNLSSDWFWEQDAQFRFTRLEGRHATGDSAAFASELGKTREELGVEVEGGWDAHHARLAAHQPFRDLVMWRTFQDGQRHFISVSGEPTFDAAGCFTGYRGVGRDVTERKRGEQLLTVEHAVTRGLAEAETASAVLRAAIRAVCETESWLCGRYLRVDEEAELLRFGEAWSVLDANVERYIESSRTMVYSPGVGMVGRVWQSGEPMWSTDITRDARVARAALAQETGMRGAFAIPVRSEGRTIGVLIFHSNELREPDERLLQAMRVISSQIGQFVRRKQAEEVLRESEERFRVIVNSANEGILVYDRALQVIGGNATAERIVGLPLADIMGAAGFTSLVPCVHEDGSPLKPEDRPTRITIRTGKAQTGRILGITRPDGSVTWLSVNTGFLRRPGEAEHYGVVSTFGDITERKRSEQATLRVGRMFAALSATNEAILHAKSPEELYERVCEAVVTGGKFSDAAIFLADPDTQQICPVAAVGMVREGLREARVSLDEKIPEGRGLIGAAFRTQRPVISNDFLNDERTRPWHEIGRTLGWRAAAALPLLMSGHSIGVVLIHYDERNAFDEEIVKLLERLAENVSFALDNFAHEAERREAQERIQYLATHDGLTDLPNRVMFSQMLNLAIQSAQRYERHFAVLFLDLDRFKIINDTLGHEAGDRLLQEMAKRLKATLRASDVVARLGGDEFVVLLQEVAEPEQVVTIARKLLSTVMKPVMIFTQECRVTASIGISLYPADAKDERALMKNADIAMYLAKEEGKNNFQFYSQEIKTQSLERLTLETSLRRALEREEFFLHYQAKLDLVSGAITGVEALVRWQHPERGLVSPLQFIPLAEETGLIVPIGRWVLRTACAQNVAWQRAGLPPVCMAVNLSPRQFAHEDLLQDLDAILRETDMAPRLLELEITESMVMGNVDRAARQLAAIKQMGVRLAIDDFGTGYSSLAQIKRFPIDTIKVDRSFIREIPKDAEDKAITEAIIAMGKTLSLTVVAEGVETKEQQTFLREHACNEMQGYYFSKPVAPEQFAELLRSHVPGLGETG